MAQRFGGTHSPGARPASAATRVHPYEGRVPTRLGLRVNLLFALPGLFAIRAFFLPVTGLALNLAAFGLMMLAAWLTREGIRAEAAYDERSVARRPAIPRKIFGAVAMALGLGLAGAWQGGPVTGAILGVVAGILHLMAFGPDPLRDKGIAGDDLNSGRVARAVEAAEDHLRAMARAIEPLKDRDLAARVASFQSAARAMCRQVEQDPRDLTAARKFLGVYLTGARDSAEKFAAYYTRTREPAARTEFVALLDDLQSNFSAKTETLLRDDRSQLDIEMAVLRERLAREPHLAPSRTLE